MIKVGVIGGVSIIDKMDGGVLMWKEVVGVCVEWYGEAMMLAF